VEVSWNPTWEPEELQNTCESFRQSLNIKFEGHIAAPNLSQPAPDEQLKDSPLPVCRCKVLASMEHPTGYGMLCARLPRNHLKKEYFAYT
jgi:hypothetical protein